MSRNRSRRQSQQKTPLRTASSKTGQPAAGKTLKPKRNVLRVYGLGGLEEVGRNCTVFEYNDSLVIVDIGLQFPEEDMPGIDYIIPNITSLRGREKQIRGIIITHGHLDHIGAISHLIEQLGNPPIFALPLTCGMIKRRHEEYGKRPLNLRAVRRDTRLTLGEFRAEFVGVSHNIPDSMAVALTTPVGTVVHTGDFKLDAGEVGPNTTEYGRIKALGQRGVLALMADSTNAMKPGRQIPEDQIAATLEKIIRDATGRVIVGTFASLVSRLGQLVKIAEHYGKKVVVEGYSMRMNLEIAKQLGYFKFKNDTFILAQHQHKYPPNKIIILCTGAQGEDRAALMRITTREHRFLRIEKGDTVIFSSSVIPGNERSVQRLTDGLYLEGAEVINYQMMDVHAGGHAQQEDLKDMFGLLKPKYLIPIHGNYSFRKIHEKVGIAAGIAPKHIFVPQNGQVVEFDRQGGRLTNDRVNTDYVFVDGLGVGDISNIVLRDRQQMADEGMVVVIATVRKNGQVVGTPDVISRGFVHVKNNFKLINEIAVRAKKILVDRDPKMPPNDVYLKEKLRDSLGQFLFQKTERRPMILPVVIEV